MVFFTWLILPAVTESDFQAFTGWPVAVTPSYPPEVKCSVDVSAALLPIHSSLTFVYLWVEFAAPAVEHAVFQENVELYMIHLCIKILSIVKITNNPQFDHLCSLIQQTQHKKLWGNTNTGFIRLLLTGEAFPGALLSLSASLSLSAWHTCCSEPFQSFIWKKTKNPGNTT